MANQYSKQSKLDAVQYYLEHKDLVRGSAENLGIGYSTLSKWMRDYRENSDIEVRGSGNYSSDEQKEIAHLKQELRNTQDALDVLKKSHQHSGKMTKTIYAGVAQRATEAKFSGRQVSVTRMLDKLEVSRSGSRSWLKHTLSAAEK